MSHPQTAGDPVIVPAGVLPYFVGYRIKVGTDLETLVRARLIHAGAAAQLYIYDERDQEYGRSVGTAYDPTAVYPPEPSDHIVQILQPDSVGHWGWECVKVDCREDATGLETATETIGSATRHGVLAADSILPFDEKDGGADPVEAWTKIAMAAIPEDSPAGAYPRVVACLNTVLDVPADADYQAQRAAVDRDGRDARTLASAYLTEYRRTLFAEGEQTEREYRDQEQRNDSTILIWVDAAHEVHRGNVKRLAEHFEAAGESDAASPNRVYAVDRFGDLVEVTYRITGGREFGDSDYTYPAVTVTLPDGVSVVTAGWRVDGRA